MKLLWGKQLNLIRWNNNNPCTEIKYSGQYNHGLHRLYIYTLSEMNASIFFFFFFWMNKVRNYLLWYKVYIYIFFLVILFAGLPVKEILFGISNTIFLVCAIHCHSPSLWNVEHIRFSNLKKFRQQCKIMSVEILAEWIN